MSAKRIYLCPLSLMACSAFGQSAYGGFHQYTQFRNWSALPGSGYALTPDGDIDPSGAVAYSTPIAYSLGAWRTVIGGGEVSADSSFQFGNLPGTGGTHAGNGTGVIAMGYDLGKAGMLTAGYMVLSSVYDHVYNFQYTPGTQSGKFRFAVGVQDTLGAGGAGDVPPNQYAPGHNPDFDSSMSLYGVGTYQVGWNGTYISAGGGIRRFEHGFASACTNLFPSAKLFVEYEGWHANAGITYAIPVGRVNLGHGKYRKVQLQLSAGEAASQYPYYGVFLTF